MLVKKALNLVIKVYFPNYNNIFELRKIAKIKNLGSWFLIFMVLWDLLLIEQEAVLSLLQIMANTTRQSPPPLLRRFCSLLVYSRKNLHWNPLVLAA